MIFKLVIEVDVTGVEPGSASYVREQIQAQLDAKLEQISTDLAEQMTVQTTIHEFEWVL